MFQAIKGIWKNYCRGSTRASFEKKKLFYDDDPAINFPVFRLKALNIIYKKNCRIFAKK